MLSLYKRKPFPPLGKRITYEYGENIQKLLSSGAENIRCLYVGVYRDSNKTYGEIINDL